MALGDLRVHRLGLSATRVTGPGVWGEPPDRAGMLALLRQAVAGGVTLLDTADAYGPEVSETLIAEALYPYPDGLVIATKGGMLRQGSNLWLPDGRPEHLRHALGGSLRRLRLDAVDLYQLHAIDLRVPIEESVAELFYLQEEGLIRHIGLCNVNLSELKRARTIAHIVSVQNRYSLAERHSEN